MRMWCNAVSRLLDFPARGGASRCKVEAGPSGAPWCNHQTDDDAGDLNPTSSGTGGDQVGGNELLQCQEPLMQQSRNVPSASCHREEHHGSSVSHGATLQWPGEVCAE